MVKREKRKGRPARWWGICWKNRLVCEQVLASPEVLPFEFVAAESPTERNISSNTAFDEPTEEDSSKAVLQGTGNQQCSSTSAYKPECE